MPETYVFLKEFKEWCNKKGLMFTAVRSKLGTIRSYYESKKIIPYRMFRHCTHKFKIIPINKYIRDTYGLKIYDIIDPENPVYKSSFTPYKENAIKKNINLVNEIPYSQMFNIDKFTLSTVVCNIVSNCIKFTSP